MSLEGTIFSAAAAGSMAMGDLHLLTTNLGCGFVSGHYALVSGHAYAPVCRHAYAPVSDRTYEHAGCHSEINY